jgi:hypothetical protein
VKRTAAAVAEPDEDTDVWAELRDEWEAFIREQEGEEGQTVRG